MQTTDTILLVRPFQFRRNEETAINNYFQSEEIPPRKIHQTATSEFDNFASLLQHAGIHTIVIQDNGIHQTPDSIFPTMWSLFMVKAPHYTPCLPIIGGASEI